MAIVQISQITNRLGLAEDLPQLAGAELGWSTDTRQLWIGNGTLEEGAPVIGNTEILTEFSDIINIAASYTYKGTAAGYTVQTGPTPGDPVVLSLQTWLDQFASVKDFGATGDGVTDDTDAINRALYQLFCRQQNPQIRRSLFFPAGVYKVSNVILVPPYATLYGEGPLNSIIQLVNGLTNIPGVVQFSDSLQQTGVNMGTNGATYPTDINISNMAFQVLSPNNRVCSIQSATNSTFNKVSFIGPGTTSTLTNDTAATSGVILFSSVSRPATDIVFDDCTFTGTTWGLYSNFNTKGITVTNSNFNTLFQGVSLGMGTIVNGGPTGTRITSNIFDNIYSEGISFGAINLNATGYNIFYDVGNFFNGVTSPSASIISFAGNNNVSIGDMFQRTAAYSTVFPRVSIGTTTSIATTNGEQIQLGTLTVKSGLRTTLLDNQPSPVAAFTFDTSLTSQGFKVNYSTTRGAGFRTGTLWVVDTGGGVLNFMDDFTENLDIGIVLSASQSGSVITVEYTAVATGSNATMSYSIDYLY
jgi:hypothetical protein